MRLEPLTTLFVLHAVSNILQDALGTPGRSRVTATRSVSRQVKPRRAKTQRYARGTTPIDWKSRAPSISSMYYAVKNDGREAAKVMYNGHATTMMMDVFKNIGAELVAINPNIRIDRRLARRLRA